MRSLAVLILVLIAGQCVYGLTPPSASAGGCVMLNMTIYCYGGSTGDSNIYELDLSKKLEIQSNDIYDQWATVTVGGASQPSVNAHFAIAAVPAYDRFVIDGGATPSGSILAKNQSTLAFQPDKRAWDLVPNMTAMTVQSHTMVLGNNSTNLLYIWGGYGRRSGQDVYWGATRTLNLNASVGFKAITNAWTFLPSLPSNFGIRSFHSAVLAKDNTTIYYIGGRLAVLAPSNTTTNASTTDLSSDYVPTDPGMSSIYAYNTARNSWTNLAVRGAAIPSSRVLHSTVLLNDGNILLYGGSQLNDTTRPVDDYFYILNTTNRNALTWSTLDISTKEAPGPGPRYGHSAIPVSNNTVFILFGGTASAPATNEVHILDVANWAWTRSFAGIGSSPASSPTGSPPHSTPTEIHPDSAGGVSGGAIAGIVVGVLAAFAIAGAIFFFVRRRRQDTGPDSGEFAREKEAMAVPYEYSGSSNHYPDNNVTAQGSDDFFSRPQEYFSPAAAAVTAAPPSPTKAHKQDGGHHTSIHRAAVLPPTATVSPASDHAMYQPEPSFNEMIYTPQLALRPIPPPPRSETPRNNDED